VVVAFHQHDVAPAGCGLAAAGAGGPASDRDQSAAGRAGLEWWVARKSVGGFIRAVAYMPAEGRAARGHRHRRPASALGTTPRWGFGRVGA